jgi:predicted dehydrogenase
VVKLWRIGIVGCGWAGERHALALKSLSERARIVALADARAEVARSRARKWQVSYWTNDYRKLLAARRLDAVPICLPHHLHITASIDAANAALHGSALEILSLEDAFGGWPAHVILAA